MAQGDTFDVRDGDEIELTFQLNIRLAEVRKRRDAAQLTHVMIDFSTGGRGGAPPPGIVRFAALDADVTGDPLLDQILPITQDNQSFTRLYRVGPMEMFVPGSPRQEMEVRATATLSAADGKSSRLIPRDNTLCTLRVRP